jgi:hypothetical protein
VGSNPAHPVMPSLALDVRNLSGLNFSGSSQKSGDRCKLYTDIKRSTPFGIEYPAGSPLCPPEEYQLHTAMLEGQSSTRKKRPPTIQVIIKRSFNTCWLTIDCNAVTKPKQKTIHFDHYIPGSVSGFRERRMSKGGCGYKRNDSATHNLKNLSFHTTNSV